VSDEPHRLGPSASPSVGDGAGGRSARRRRLAEAAGVVALALTLNLTGNGRTSLWDRDEPRYAGCTREMRARGDWVYPTFNGEPRFHKPVLIYWLMRGGFALGGDNPFGARLVSGLAGAATCVLVLRLGRKIGGDRVGLLAAAALASAPIMVIESKLATTDATLALLVVVAQSALWDLRSGPSRRAAAAFWAALALATLTKGPVGPALVAVSGLVSWWWGGPASAWRRLGWRWGPLLFLGIAGPWFVAVGLRSHGAFFRFAVGKQIAERMVSGVEQHDGFPGYYLVTSLLTFHPWSALLPAALYAAWTRRRSDSSAGFLLGWVVGPWILLECVRTKLVHYYLPAFPACALLAARLAVEAADRGVDLRAWRLGRAGLGLLGAVGVGVAGALVAGAFVLPTPLRLPCLAAAAAVSAATWWGFTRLRRGQAGRAAAGLVGAWSLTLLILGGWLLPAAEPYRTSRVVGERLARLAEVYRAQPILLSFQEPTVVYTMGRPAPMIRTWERFYEEVDRHGAVVTAIIPLEVPEFDRRRDHLDIDVREVVRGYDLNKGRTRTLRLALIRRKPPASVAPPVIAAAEQFEVE